VMVPAVLLLADQGVVGVAIAVVISHIVGAAYSLFQVNRILPGTAWPTLRAFVPFLSAGAVMVVVVQMLKPVIMPLAGDTYALLGLLALVAIGAVVYIGLIFLLQKALMIELINLFISAFSLGGRLSTFSIRERAK